MSTDVITNLPPDFAARVTALATSAGCSPGDALTSILKQSLGAEDAMVKMWSDDHVLAAADLTLPPAVQDQLSELLQAQQERSLSPSEQSELANLMEIYKSCQLQKARGMMEAQKRGLRNYPMP
jgi:hypothetical protein